MKIFNVNEQILQEALKLTNTSFDDNIIWNRAPDSMNNANTTFRLTLRVKSSSGKGARRAAFTGHKMISACWHVHGFFMDHIFNVAKLNGLNDLYIRVATQKLESKADNWKDYNIGSEYRPCDFSTACEC